MSIGYQEIVIQPAHGGFGEYNCVPGDFIWADKYDLLAEIASNIGQVWELGADELPDGLEDIRGRIHHEPQSVYGWLDEAGQAHYLGIDPS